MPHLGPVHSEVLARPSGLTNAETGCARNPAAPQLQLQGSTNVGLSHSLGPRTSPTPPTQSQTASATVSPPNAGAAQPAQHYRIASPPGSRATGSSKAVRKAKLQAELARAREATLEAELA